MKYLLFIILFFLISFSAKSQVWFKQPQMSSPVFIQKTTESITDLIINSGSISSIQATINAAVAANPTNIIRITLNGNYTVTDNPLILADRMLLNFKNVILQAASNATATSLIRVSNASNVSINAIDTCVLDGNNVSGIKGIDIINSGKTHVDKLTIKNCSSGGISYVGKGAAIFADAGSVTRCNIINCTNFGIQFINSFHFICTDNEVNNSSVGISAVSDNSIVSKNIIKNCSTGLSVNGLLAAIAYNSIKDNVTGIALYSANSEALVSYNSIDNNSTGLYLNSTFARIFYNSFLNNATKISGTGTNNQLSANKGLFSGEEGSVGTFFDPPTTANLHSNLIRTGKTRYDIDVNSSANSSLSNIRTVIDAAHISQPNAVILARLNGNFLTASSADSLLIKDNECIILNGSITNGSGESKSVIYFSGNSSSASSFSGGTIDGKNGTNGKNALIYITNGAQVILDSISVQNSGGEGITKRSSTGPTFIRACTINGSASRGIWQLASKRLFAFENIITNTVKYDGIDLDAFSETAVVVKNSINNSKRFGIFLEEGANNHTVLNNNSNANNRGISFYNLSVNNKNTTQNLIAFNICKLNERGIHVDASSADKATINNVIFNNICESNTDVGIGGLYSTINTSNNYFALNTLKNNLNGNYYSAAKLDVNFAWNMIASANAVLPIQIINFSGSKVTNGIQLQWQTNNDQFIRSFEIERFVNNNIYETVQTKSSSRNLNGFTYSFLDTKPSVGKSYYRIKQIDDDNNFFYSKVILFDIENFNNNFLKYSFLTTNELEVNLSVDKTFNKVNFQLFDLSGKMILSNSYTVSSLNQFQTIIPLPILANGIYILKASTPFSNISKKINIY